VKSACSRSGLRSTFGFKSIRLHNTQWQVLLLVGREFNPDPASWSDLEVLDRAVWVGVVTREDYVEVLKAKVAADGGDLMSPHDAAVSVGPNGMRSWLGHCVSWCRLRSISASWWAEHLI